MDGKDVAQEKTQAASLDEKTEFKLRGLRYMVGNSPMLAIDCTFLGKRRTIYAKAENLNMTGSIKDRMALHIVHQGYVRGLLEPGALIVEATSGNTGISFAGIGRALGHACKIFIPNWMSDERIRLIQSFGVETILVSREQGGFVGSIKRAEEHALSDPDAFLPRQFLNENNSDAHERTTGPEILAQLESVDLVPDAFVAGVGTGGTIMGVGRYLSRHLPNVRIHPLEPSNSPTLSTGTKVGSHRIQGISDEFVPPIIHLDELDEVVDVADGDAILMAQQLANSLGLGVGISSGANFLGAVQLQHELGTDATVVTLFPDSNKKYLSTDLLREEPVVEGYMTPEIALLGFEAIERHPALVATPA
jgi:cysteine synthase A